MKDINRLLSEISQSIPPEKRPVLEEDITKYSQMDLTTLPDFHEDGSVAMYEIGGILLGKNALVRFIERCK